LSDHGSPIGFAVDEIIDIVEDRLELKLADDRPGVLGYAVIKGSATEILDPGHFLAQTSGRWFRRHVAA
jgi:two-component system, chemotaxis family, sensor kinase CheA